MCLRTYDRLYLIVGSADKLTAVRRVTINKFSNPLASRRDVSFTAMASSVARGGVPFRRTGCSDSDCCRSFPGAGNRNNVDGTLINVGVRGHYWVSSPLESGSGNASILWFINDGTLSSVQNTNRANAFSVRCVSVLIFTIFVLHSIIRSAA